LNFSLFNIDIGAFEMQLLELKNKELWSSKFERLNADIENLEKNKCDLNSQQKWSALKDLEKEDMIIFNAWNSIPDSYDQLKKTSICCSSTLWLYIFMRTIFLKHELYQKYIENSSYW
jgi:hypothetical protein